MKQTKKSIRHSYTKKRKSKIQGGGGMNISGFTLIGYNKQDNLKIPIIIPNTYKPPSGDWDDFTHDLKIYSPTAKIEIILSQIYNFGFRNMDFFYLLFNLGVDNKLFFCDFNDDGIISFVKLSSVSNVMKESVENYVEDRGWDTLENDREFFKIIEPWLNSKYQKIIEPNTPYSFTYKSKLTNRETIKQLELKYPTLFKRMFVSEEEEQQALQDIQRQNNVSSGVSKIEQLESQIQTLMNKIDTLETHIQVKTQQHQDLQKQVDTISKNMSDSWREKFRATLSSIR